jgi:hypothetical protein
MKKYIFIAVAGLLALSSCSNDDNEELNVKNTPRQMTFNAGYVADAAKTRATLNTTPVDGKWQVSFDAKDEISIISAENENTPFTTTAGGKLATFTGYAITDSKYYSVYPYTSGLSLSGTTINGIVIPASQWNDNWDDDGGASGWDPKAPVAWAETTDNNLHFYNLCAILKIQTTGTGSSAITISADEVLAGTFRLDIDTSTSPSTAALTATASATSVSTPYPVAAGNDLYIAIAPGTKNNFRIVSAGTDKTKPSSVTFQAGYVYNLGQVSVGN